MSSVEEVADQSAVLHKNAQAGSAWKQHMWEERGACPFCGTEVTPAKEPPPPATEERIEDIAEVLPPAALRITPEQLEEAARQMGARSAEDQTGILDINALDEGPITKLFGFGEMTDGD